MHERLPGLTQHELQRLRRAYGSQFYRSLVRARVELHDAIQSLDAATLAYEQALDRKLDIEEN